MSALKQPINRFRSRPLGAAALALGTTPLASMSSATVIYDLGSSYSTGQTFSLEGTAFSEIELVLTGMMAIDLSLDAPVAGMMGDSSTVEFVFFSSGGMMSTDFLEQLTAGDTVDSSLAYTSQAFLVDDDVINPNWAAGTTAYAGFVFDPYGTGPLYGWVQLQFDASGNNFSIQQWAYDDTGAPIQASFVPEPEPALLLMIGLLGLAAAGRKRSPRGDEPG